MTRAPGGCWSQWCVVAVLTAVGSASLSAQDSHYWILQYGARSSLLGGAEIGSVSDVSNQSGTKPNLIGGTISLGFLGDVQPFIEVARDHTLLASVVDERRSVVNWAVGLEHRVNPRWTGFASYSSDNSTNPMGLQLSDLS